jgi:hypothetical protein
VAWLYASKVKAELDGILAKKHSTATNTTASTTGSTASTPASYLPLLQMQQMQTPPTPKLPPLPVLAELLALLQASLANETPYADEAREKMEWGGKDQDENE